MLPDGFVVVVVDEPLDVLDVEVLVLCGEVLVVVLEYGPTGSLSVSIWEKN